MTDTKAHKTEQAINTVYQLLTADDSAATLADCERHKIYSDAPSAKWSLGNRMLMLFNGTHDARGFKQWKEVNRSVVKGAKSFSILGPRFVKDKDADDPNAKKLIGFIAIPVFGIEQTEGESLPGVEPAEMPALLDAAERLGYSVSWADTGAAAYGYANHITKQIVLGSHDDDVFWHELAHAAHRSFEPKARGGQEPEAEVIAETVAAVLAELYGEGASGKHVAYIKSYCGADAKMATRLATKVAKVLDILLPRAS